MPFDSPQRGDSNELLPDSCGPVPGELSTFSNLLTAIDVPMLGDLYHSIPLGVWTSTDYLPTLSDHRLLIDLYLCTLTTGVSNPR